MEKIKLVQIIADSQMGGGPNQVLGLLQNIDRDKYDCYLICPTGILTRNAEKLPKVTIINLPFKTKFDLQTILALKRELQRIQAKDNPFAKMIIHSHGPRAGLFCSLVDPKDATKIFTEHNYTQFYHLSNWFNSFVQAQMMDSVYRKNDCIIAVSTAVKQYLSKIKVNKSKVVVIHNGFDPIDYKRTSGKREDIIIGTVGSLNPMKGQKYLISALPEILKKYPNVRLEIVGEGPEKDNLITEARRLNVSKRVALLGMKTDLDEYYSRWRVFALPSVSETFGLVILEAMSAGLPVVATKSGGVADIIKDKMNGLLVERNNPTVLAKAIIQVLDNPELAENLTKNASKELPNFSWKVAIEKLEEIYKNA